MPVSKRVLPLRNHRRPRCSMTTDEIRCLLDYLQRQRQGMVDLLTRLALAESPSDEPAAVALVLALLASEIEQCGLWVRLLRGRVSGGILFAGTPDRRRHFPRQLLIGHCDTVWPLGMLGRMPVQVEGDVRSEEHTSELQSLRH